MGARRAPTVLLVAGLPISSGWRVVQPAGRTLATCDAATAMITQTVGVNNPLGDIVGTYTDCHNIAIGDR